SFRSSLRPVSRTCLAFTTTTKSPPSTCGEKVGLCLPRRMVATREAKRPSTLSLASATNHCRTTSASEMLRVGFFGFDKADLSQRKGERRALGYLNRCPGATPGGGVVGDPVQAQPLGPGRRPRACPVAPSQDLRPLA